MNSKVLNALNLLAILLAFVVAEAPRLINVLAPYPRACAFVGVSIGVLSSLSRLVIVLMAALRSGKALFIEKSKDETPSSPIPPAVITLLVIGFLVAWGRPVQAQTQTDLPASLPQLGFDIGNIGSCQPAVAVSAFQVNLKTKDVKRVALMGGFGCLFHNWVVPYGAALYIGSGISEAEGASPQANLLIHVSNWIAFGPGVQAIKLPSGDRVFQGLLSFVGSLSFGGTTTYVKEQAVQAAVRTERIMRAAPNSGHIPGN